MMAQKVKRYINYKLTVSIQIVQKYNFIAHIYFLPQTIQNAKSNNNNN